MRIPRITIKGLLIAVAVIAVDCYLVVKVFPGILLPAIGLNVGLVCILRRGGRGRRFWIAYEVTGILILGICVWLMTNMEEVAAQWPTTVLNFLVDRLSPAAQAFVAPMLDQFFDLQDDYFGLIFMQVSLFEATIGLPLLLCSALVGWVVTRIVPGPVTHSGPVESGLVGRVETQQFPGAGSRPGLR